MAKQTITVNGLSFAWCVEPEYDMGAPWLEHDGHGVVEERSRQDSRWPLKRPGELLLHRAERGGTDLFYDLQATLTRARAEQWGLSEPQRLQLAEELGRVPTQREVTRRAVQRDYERMRAWHGNEWWWVMVECTLLDADGHPTRIYDTLSGIESDNEAYHEEVAHELAEQILSGRGDPDKLDSITVGAVTWRLR